MAELGRNDSYTDLRDTFRWDMPPGYNLAWSLCRRWDGEPERPALVELSDEGDRREWTHGALAEASARLANLLVQQAGLQRGERCAILLPQRALTVISHVAVYRIGAVALPMFTLFGEEALAYRLRDAGVRVVITDMANVCKIEALRDRLPDLRCVYVATDRTTDRATNRAAGPDDGFVRGLEAAMERAATSFEDAVIGAADPAFISYTSGTTGPAKGVLHAHRVLLGHLPGIQLAYDWFPQPQDRMWTPADWAWMGGLANVMMPALHFGVPLVAYRAKKFDPLEALAMMKREEVRNAFVPPTALRIIRQSFAEAGDKVPKLRSLASGGEALGAKTHAWGQEAFGFTLNEFYGQTECNFVLSNCASLFPPRPNSAGKAVPGHRVEAINADGEPVARGEIGEISVQRPNPVMFLCYWNRAEATEKKFTNDWMRTGDLGKIDEDGYVYIVARDDDLITSAGYRIGPGEIEDCLCGHPAVALAAVVGLPDELRTERVTAFIVRNDGGAGADSELREELQGYVRTRLSGHLVPRQVEFVGALPRTSTGKIMRGELRKKYADS